MNLRTISVTLALTTSAMALEKPPFPYVWGKAYHIMPGTHNQESGYFSLCEGRDGKIYVGAAKYGVDSFLVEFDPETEKQRIVVDTHKLCGLTNTGYAAQAKIHTRNFVGPSGKVYFGSKQGYRLGEKDTVDYPGGYVMTYDPVTDKAECLGMPMPGQGVIDVVADEKRGLLYIVTCEDQHWMVYDTKTKTYKELGPLLTPYATTLINPAGQALAITKDFQLAAYDPATGAVTVRPIELDGKPWLRANDYAIPCWVMTPDARRAYLILLNDPTLVEFDLMTRRKTVRLISHGRMVGGKGFDSRCALSLGPDGRVYAVGRVDNETGFGTGYLHHLVRFDPKRKKMADLGVLAVKNPDYADFSEGIKFRHGFHRLPDGTLTPLHVHMAMIVAGDGTVYTTILYPFTLLRVTR